MAFQIVDVASCKIVIQASCFFLSIDFLTVSEVAAH